MRATSDGRIPSIPNLAGEKIMTTTGRYTLVQRLLHWLIALLAIPALGVGMTLGWLGFEGARDSFGIDITNALYTGHKTIGVLILLLMTLRLVLRLTLGSPPPVPTLTPFERIASRTVQAERYKACFTWCSWPCPSSAGWRRRPGAIRSSSSSGSCRG